MALRWLLYLLIWLALTFFSLKFCIEPECCNAGEEIGAVDDGNGVTDPVENTYALPTLLNSGDIDQGADYAALLDRLRSEYAADSTQRLQIYGNYYADEAAPDGFENMGFARAERIAQMIHADLGIPLDKMDRLARLISEDLPAADSPWEGGRFAWAADMGDDEGPQVIELSSDEITIRFPFDKSTKDLGTEVESYLETLTQRLLQTDERVEITGHTDNIDTDAYNMRLGQQRADFVKSRLVAYGAPADRIATRSEGESNPEATNGTSAGRAINRRAVVRLMPN